MNGLGSTFTLPRTSITVNRVGYGAIRLAWLLQRSPNLLLIPGTSSPEHLRENLRAATLQLPADVLASLNAIAATAERQDH